MPKRRLDNRFCRLPDAKDEPELWPEKIRRALGYLLRSYSVGVSSNRYRGMRPQPFVA